MSANRLQALFLALRDDTRALFEQLFNTCPQPCLLVEEPALHVFNSREEEPLPQFWFVARQGYHVEAEIVSVYQQGDTRFVGTVESESSKLGYAPLSSLNTEQLLDLCAEMVKHTSEKETLTPTVHRLLQLWENLQTDVFRLIKELGPTKLVEDPDTYLTLDSAIRAFDDLPKMWFIDNVYFHVTAEILQTFLEGDTLQLDVLDEEGERRLYPVEFITLPEALGLLAAIESNAKCLPVAA